MTIRYSTVLLFLFGLQSTESWTILTCISRNSASPQLTCPNNDDIIWVKNAYLASTLNATPKSFCDTPTLDPARNDCVSSVDDVTNDVNTKCAMYQNCRYIVEYGLLNCNASYSGFTYLYAEFECLPTRLSGVNLPSFIISDARTAFGQPGISYFRSADYPSYSPPLRGACRLQVPANTRATWRLLDLRGRLINLSSGCAYVLQIYTRFTYRQWCAELAWKPEQFEMTTSNEAEILNLYFYPVYRQNSEGKVWLSLNLTDANGAPVNKINITCGRNVILDTAPTTTFSNTSSRPTITTRTPDAPYSDTTTTTTHNHNTTSTSTTTTASTTTQISSTTTTSSTSTMTSTTTTNPTTTPLTPNPSTTSPLSGFSIAQPSSSIDSTQLSTPGVAEFLSTPLGGSRPSMSTPAKTENGTSKEYEQFPENGTNPLTILTQTTKSNEGGDRTTWLIIGLTVGGGLLLLILIIVAISICGYKKRKAKAQSQSDVIFAWERAAADNAASDAIGAKNAPTSAKPKVNTYCREPTDIYLEIIPSNTTGNSPIERSTRPEAPPHRPKNLNSAGQTRVNTLQAASISNEVQINPVYGHLSITNYVLPMDGEEASAIA